MTKALAIITHARVVLREIMKLVLMISTIIDLEVK